MSSRKSVSSGGCLLAGAGGMESFCALSSTQCPSVAFPAMVFRSTREMEFEGGWASCLTRANTEKIYIGKCGDDKCAADQFSCDDAYGGVYSPVRSGSMYPECQIKNALFGSCNGRCVWSSNDCVTGETYTLPSKPESYVPTETDCTCDNVQVGGCKRDGAPIYCAVEAAACDSQQRWLSPQEVVDQEDKSCYLCRKDITPTNNPPPVTPSPVSAPVQPVNDKPSPSPPSPTTITNNNSKTNNNDSKNSTNNGLIVGVAVGGTLIVLIPLIAAFILFRRRRNQKETHPPPPVSFDAKNQGVMDDEELSMT